MVAWALERIDGSRRGSRRGARATTVGLRRRRSLAPLALGSVEPPCLRARSSRWAGRHWPTPVARLATTTPRRREQLVVGGDGGAVVGVGALWRGVVRGEFSQRARLRAPLRACTSRSVARPRDSQHTNKTTVTWGTGVGGTRWRTVDPEAIGHRVFLVGGGGSAGAVGLLPGLFFLLFWLLLSVVAGWH